MMALRQRRLGFTIGALGALTALIMRFGLSSGPPTFLLVACGFCNNP
jgi:hypothetical protein